MEKDITLPALPAGYAPEVAAAMRNYARAAVLADREAQGRQEAACPYIASREIISRPGAKIVVTALHLTERGRRAITVRGDANIPGVGAPQEDE